MRNLLRSTAVAAASALLLAAGSPPRLLSQPPESDDRGPCEVYCDALHALCLLFGGGGLCHDMRDGCRFGCTLRVT